MAKKPPERPREPMPPEERLGHVWAGVFLFLVVSLIVVLVGKGCFFAS